MKIKIKRKKPNLKKKKIKVGDDIISMSDNEDPGFVSEGDSKRLDKKHKRKSLIFKKHKKNDDVAPLTDDENSEDLGFVSERDSKKLDKKHKRKSLIFKKHKKKDDLDMEDVLQLDEKSGNDDDIVSFSEGDFKKIQKK